MAVRPPVVVACPRCGVSLTRIEQRIDQPTRYWPCGHEDFLTHLTVHQ